MAQWSDVERIVAGLPGAEESTSFGNRAWKVGTKTFAWQRPFSKADRARAAKADDELWDGDVLAVRVEDEGAKRAVLSDESLPCFTIPHFDGYAAVLVRFEQADDSALTELITEAWLCMAPADLVEAYRGGERT